MHSSKLTCCSRVVMNQRSTKTKAAGIFIRPRHRTASFTHCQGCVTDQLMRWFAHPFGRSLLSAASLQQTAVAAAHAVHLVAIMATRNTQLQCIHVPYEHHYRYKHNDFLKSPSCLDGLELQPSILKFSKSPILRKHRCFLLGIPCDVNN